MPSWISVDTETDGPIPGDYSMIAIGAVVVDNPDVGFCEYIKPISESFEQQALDITGYSRNQCFKEPFHDPLDVMLEFDAWIKSVASTPYIFVADNNGFDWMFCHWYMIHFLDRDPFGYSSKNINSIYHGLTKDSRASFKHLRKTKHTHNPEDDARGNAEALLYMRDEMGFKVKF